MTITVVFLARSIQAAAQEALCIHHLHQLDVSWNHTYYWIQPRLNQTEVGCLDIVNSKFSSFSSRFCSSDWWTEVHQVYFRRTGRCQKNYRLNQLLVSLGVHTCQTPFRIHLMSFLIYFQRLQADWEIGLQPNHHQVLLARRHLSKSSNYLNCFYFHKGLHLYLRPWLALTLLTKRFIIKLLILKKLHQSWDDF